MYEDELKTIDTYFEYNGRFNFLPAHLSYELTEMNKDLLKIDELLYNAGVSGINHVDHSSKIEYSMGMLGELISYSDSLGFYALELLDRPLNKNLKSNALSSLEKIDIASYKTTNELGIKKDGAPTIVGPVTKVECGYLTLSDFLGITNRYDVPDEFKGFSNQFATYYENVKDTLIGDDGKPISLEKFLYHMLDKMTPEERCLEFLSVILDITIVKPLMDVYYGKDVITKRKLTDFERGMQFATAVIGIVTLGTSGLIGAPLDQAANRLAKMILVDIASTSASYATGIVCDKLGLPVAITVIICIVVGTSTSITLNGIEFRKIKTAEVDYSIPTEKVVPPGSKNPVEVYTDGNAQVNRGKVDKYIRGKVELDVDGTTKRLRELENIQKNNPSLYTKEMDKEYKRLDSQLHNYQRSQEMSRTLINAGIQDTPENTKKIVDALFEAANEVKLPNETKIPKIIDGPNGKVIVESWWKVSPDGTKYLSTIILKPVK